MSKARRIWVQPSLEDLRHLALIPGRIEARLDRVRIDENLAQGQGRCKNLDEDRAHSAAIIGSSPHETSSAEQAALARRRNEPCLESPERKPIHRG